MCWESSDIQKLDRKNAEQVDAVIGGENNNEYRGVGKNAPVFKNNNLKTVAFSRLK